MTDEINNQVNVVDTDATSEKQGNEQPTETLENKVNDSQVEEKPVQKTYTQEELNEKIRNRLDRARQSLYNKYGVEDEYGLDVMHGKAQDYDNLYADMKNKIAEHNELVDRYNLLVEEIAFIRNNVEPRKIDDIRTYFKGKGMEIDEDTLRQAIATHPEWQKARIIANNNVGSLKQETAQPINEDDIAKKYFGLNSFTKK